MKIYRIPFLKIICITCIILAIISIIQINYSDKPCGYSNNASSPEQAVGILLQGISQSNVEQICSITIGNGGANLTRNEIQAHIGEIRSNLSLASAGSFNFSTKVEESLDELYELKIFYGGKQLVTTQNQQSVALTIKVKAMGYARIINNPNKLTSRLNDKDGSPYLIIWDPNPLSSCTVSS